MFVACSIGQVGETWPSGRWNAIANAVVLVFILDLDDTLTMGFLDMEKKELQKWEDQKTMDRIAALERSVYGAAYDGAAAPGSPPLLPVPPSYAQLPGTYMFPTPVVTRFA